MPDRNLVKTPARERANDILMRLSCPRNCEDRIASRPQKSVNRFNETLGIIETSNLLITCGLCCFTQVA